MQAKSLQSCPALCDPMDCSPLGSSVHGILQARILRWVTISFSWGSSKSGIEPRSLALQADSLPSEPPGMQGEAGPGHLSTGLGEDLGFYSESLKLLESLKV